MIVAMPQNLQQFTAGLSESRQNGTIRTPMSAGAPKSRRRFSAVTKRLQGQIALLPAELDEFWTFFEVTLSEGAKNFTFTHPITGANLTASFAGTPQIAYPEKHGLRSRVSISIDILP